MTRLYIITFCLIFSSTALATKRAPNQLLEEMRRCNYYSTCTPFDDLRKWKALVAPLLVERLAETHYSMRYFVHRAIKEIGPDAVPYLIKGLSSENRRVRHASTNLLGQIGDHRALEPLLQAYGRSNRHRRLRIIRAIGQLKLPSSGSILLNFYQTSRYSNKSAVLRAMADSPHPSFIPVLLPLIKSGRHLSHVTRALGALRAKEAIPLLMSKLKTRIGRRYSTWQTTYLALALGKIGAKEAVPLLLKLVGHRNRRVRAAATLALGLIGSPKTLAAAKNLLNERYMESRIHANTALFLVTKKGEYLDALHRMCDHSSSTTRGYVAKALGLLKQRRSAAILTARLRQEVYANVRQYLVNALRRISTRNFGENVELWERWSR